MAVPAAAAAGHSRGGAAATHAHGNAGTSGDPQAPQPPSRADQNAGGANGKCPGGPYCSTRDGSPSENGNGHGRAVGKPCAGCVGRADNKNPKGQYPGPSDRNAGYECDRNHGVGRSNPAHTGCGQTTPPSGCTQDCGGDTPPPGCTQDCGGHQPPPGCTHDCGTTSPPAGCPGQPGMPAGQCQPTTPPVATCLRASKPCLVSPPRETTHVAGHVAGHVAHVAVAGPRVSELARPHAVRTVSGPTAGTLPNTGAPDTLAAELAGALLLLLGGLALSGHRMRRTRRA
ncbi:MAG TPA: hypothetical protein VI452_16585 [Marmoricola sp.]